MRNPIVRIATLCLVLLLLYQFSCDEVCHMKKLNSKNIQEMITLSWQIADTQALLSWLKADYKDVAKRVEHWSWLISMYDPKVWWVAYAGRDDDKITTWSTSVESWDDIGNQTPNKIVLHHSATLWSNDYNKVLTSANRAHALRVKGNQPSNQLQDQYPEISYHYVIFPDGHIFQARRETRVGRGARENNAWVIHIMLVGDFTKENPTDLQYSQLNKVISEIQTRHAIWSITGHGQNKGEHSSCPGENFDYLRVDQIKKWDDHAKAQVVNDPNYLWVMSITRYYSCTKNQTKRLSREKNTGQDNYTACNNRQFLGDVDNTQPKYWARYTNADAWIAIACPREIPARTKLRIEWYDQIVTCRDVWSAIKNKRLDLYTGIGDRAIDNFHRFPTGNHKVWIVE